MALSLTSMIGFLAAFFTTAAFLPQAIRTIQTRDTHGISLLMYLLFTAGVALWLTYGLMLGDLPLIVANLVTLVLALTVLAFKIRYG